MMLAVALLLCLGAAWTGQAQTPPPPCSLVLARKVPTKAVMAGRAFTTAVKVTNTASMPVVANLGVGLPDNVCAVRDAVFPRLKKTSSPARNGATVANQIVYWLEVPISPAKSRSFKLKARVSSNYTTTTTSISTSAYILDQGGNVTCLSTLADAPLAIRARKKGPRPGTVLNCTRPAPPPLNVKFFHFAANHRLLYGFEVPVASAVSVMAAGFADQCYSACGSAQYALLSPYYFATTSTNKCFCSQSPDLVYDAMATVFRTKTNMCQNCQGCAHTTTGTNCECTCPQACGEKKCGRNQRRCGGLGLKDEGSCTPYYFLPNVQNQDTSWFSRSPFAIDKVLENAKPFCGKSWDCFQAWQTPGGLYKDQWVTHGGDGAGIQPLDCGGDIGYFEHFDGKGKTHPQGFNHNTYGPKYGACDLTTSISRECNGHIPSYFNHPSKPVVPFNLYECGWWRAYDNPRDASIVKFESGFCSEKALLDAPYYPPGQRLTQSVPTNPNCYGKGRSVTDGGLLGAMGTGGDWFTQSVYAFRNTEDGPELGALWHTFAYTNGKPCGMPPDNLPCPKYKAWLTGTVFPWVCMDNGPDDLLCPWNNEQNNYEKCYCDNEPWRGRNNDPQNPREPNWNTKLVYCVVDDSNNMLCDSIILLNNKREGEYNPVTGCTQNACGGYSKKDATFKLQATSWPPQ